jgi:hypothetical protein
MAILDHSNVPATLGIYTHVDEDSRRDALERMPGGRNLIPRRLLTLDAGAPVTLARTHGP